MEAFKDLQANQTILVLTPFDSGSHLHHSGSAACSTQHLPSSLFARQKSGQIFLVPGSSFNSVTPSVWSSIWYFLSPKTLLSIWLGPMGAYFWWDQLFLLIIWVFFSQILPPPSLFKCVAFLLPWTTPRPSFLPTLYIYYFLSLKVFKLSFVTLIIPLLLKKALHKFRYNPAI